MHRYATTPSLHGATQQSWSPMAPAPLLGGGLLSPRMPQVTPAVASAASVRVAAPAAGHSAGYASPRVAYPAAGSAAFATPSPIGSVRLPPSASGSLVFPPRPPAAANGFTQTPPAGVVIRQSSDGKLLHSSMPVAHGVATADTMRSVALPSRQPMAHVVSRSYSDGRLALGQQSSSPRLPIGNGHVLPVAALAAPPAAQEATNGGHNAPVLSLATDVDSLPNGKATGSTGGLAQQHLDSFAAAAAAAQTPSSQGQLSLARSAQPSSNTTTPTARQPRISTSTPSLRAVPESPRDGHSDYLSMTPPQSPGAACREQARNDRIPEPAPDHRRPVDRCHDELYRDAFSRQARQRQLREAYSQVRAHEEQQQLAQQAEVLRRRRQLYRGGKDRRPHLQREEAWLRRKEQKLLDKQEEVDMDTEEREMKELKECTFSPRLVTRVIRQSSQKSLLSSSGSGSSSALGPMLHGLVARQRAALEGWKQVAADENLLKGKLRALHLEHYQRIQREEVRRVTELLQNAEPENVVTRELSEHIEAMIKQGVPADVARKQVVDELAAKSKDEVQKKVSEIVEPKRIEAENDIYSKRVELIAELEALEREGRGIALKPHGKEVLEALGFNFGLARVMARRLPEAPADPSPP
eukprot:TRINITY_DN51911_c0_g1_i1.p1 TRINITY_DN51911_c0_g1~~TRINITY_DN51911_c0_g1_i1.p1  ORF type:complete len:639 (+),score=157.52 TRINITY_DN51911_c0_g1_i1:106-2022(+)